MNPQTTRRKTRNKKLERAVHCLFKKSGQKALKTAKEMMREEADKISSLEACEAIRYFVDEYWNDLVSPTLISLGCEAVGGDIAHTIPVAVPIILLSGGVDIHDDIIDRSKTKYGRLTVLGKYGDEFALLIGDALLLKGFTLLYDAMQSFPQKEFLNIINVVKDTFFELGDAEALELKFRKNLNIVPQQYILTMEKKAADVEGLLRIGAIIGNGSVEEIDALARYGRIFGLLSILRDDWIDMIDCEEAKHRLLSENPPLPMLYALSNTKAKMKLRQIHQKEKVTRQDVEKMSEITERYGGFKQSRKIMLSLAKKAEKYLAEADITHDKLRLLLRFVTTIG